MGNGKVKEEKKKEGRKEVFRGDSETANGGAPSALHPAFSLHLPFSFLFRSSLRSQSECVPYSYSTTIRAEVDGSMMAQGLMRIVLYMRQKTRRAKKSRPVAQLCKAVLLVHAWPPRIFFLEPCRQAHPQQDWQSLAAGWLSLGGLWSRLMQS